ncbi:MAG: hypothetical protein NVS4B2_11380 [Chloroflexota bacterium]
MTIIFPLTFAVVDPQKATVYWYVARGSGFVVFALLTFAVCLGLLLSLRWRTDAWPRVITEDLHQFILLTAGVFLTIHVVSTLLDTFIHFRWYEVLIPFTSSYRSIWLSLGIVSMYLGAALALSIYLRPFIGYRAWRTMHYAGFLAWSLALIHGLTTGTDARAPWAKAVYIGSILLIVALLAVRFGGIPVRLGSPPRLRMAALASLAALLLLGGRLVVVGPWAPGWASRAQALPFRSNPPRAAMATLGVPESFREPVSGTAQVENSPSVQQGTGLLHLQLALHGRYPSRLSYAFLLAASQSGPQFIRGIFSLAATNLAWSCSGTATFQPPDVVDSTCTMPGHRTTEVVTRFRISRSGVVSGTVTVVPSAKPKGLSDNEGRGDHDTGSLVAGA